MNPRQEATVPDYGPNHMNSYIAPDGMASYDGIRAAADRRLKQRGWTTTIHHHSFESDCGNHEHEEVR